jgi:hypothetical protein
LPILSDYDTILEAWPLDCVELLANPALVTKMAARPTSRRETFAKLLVATHSSDGRLFSCFDETDFLWALLTVRSRTFLSDFGGSIDDMEVAMVPVADM